jgi:hypothetical protein
MTPTLPAPRARMPQDSGSTLRLALAGMRWADPLRSGRDVALLAELVDADTPSSRRAA